MSNAATTHGAIGGPSPWIVRFAPLVKAGARVLDVACGEGRHSRYFAALGCQVVAVDRDAALFASLTNAPRIKAVAADLENGKWPFAGQRFDAIVVTNYLHRALFPHLLDALASDGVLLYETFAAGNEAYGKPSNPDFLLLPGELLRLCGDALTVIAFEQGLAAGERPVVLQRIAAVGRRRPWPPMLPG